MSWHLSPLFCDHHIGVYVRLEAIEEQPRTQHLPGPVINLSLHGPVVYPSLSQELDLSFNRISGMGIAALAASLRDSRCQVSTLSLAQNGFGRRGGEHLALVLVGGEHVDAWGKVYGIRYTVHQ